MPRPAIEGVERLARDELERQEHVSLFIADLVSDAILGWDRTVVACIA